MSRATDQQARDLRRRLAMLLLRWSLVYLAIFLACVLVFELTLRDRVSYRLADATATTVTMPADDVENYLMALDVPRDSIVTIENDDGTVDVRNLSVYYNLRSMRWPLTAALFFAGYAGIVIALLRRSVSYFEELSGAVAGLMRHREEPVRLSDALVIAQGELNEIREQTLADERAKAEAERRKNELVAYLAHDIRTPLTSVIGYLSLLDEAPDLPESQRTRYVSTALAKAETLDALTSEFFEITRYNLTTIPIERSDIDARLFLEQLADEFLPELRANGLTIRVDAPDGASLHVDSEKMARALGNVIRNAITYADAGTELGLVARRHGVQGWTIVVRDRGREIAPEHLESIFDRFFRTDTARSAGGHAGLGLAIAREIVQAHGGSIRAESAGGVTTFTIELP